LRSVWVLATRHSTPNRRHHVVSRVVAVRDNALGGLRDWYPLTLEILAESVIELGQAAELEVGHGLLVLLDLRRIANIT